MPEYVAKPLLGREGGSVRIVTADEEITNPGIYGDEGWCYQEFRALPQFAGNRMVLGSWVVDGESAGAGRAGERESDHRRLRAVPAALHRRATHPRESSTVVGVNFDAYARTGVDLVNARLDDLDDLRALFPDENAWMRDEVDRAGRRRSSAGPRSGCATSSSTAPRGGTPRRSPS